MNPRTFTEFSVYLRQRPGELAGVLDAASVAGIEILSLSTAEHLDRGCVRLIGQPEAALRRVCESLVEAGIGPVVEAPVLCLDVSNRTGVIRDLALLMADHGINIRYCYLVPPISGQGPSLCLFRFDEHDRAMELVEKADWATSVIERDPGGESAA